MAIIYSYPTVIPTESDLVLGTDVDAAGQPTKNFTVKSIIDLVTVIASLCAWSGTRRGNFHTPLRSRSSQQPMKQRALYVKRHMHTQA